MPSAHILLLRLARVSGGLRPGSRSSAWPPATMRSGGCGVVTSCEGDMVWLIAGHLVTFLMDLVAGARRTTDEKDLEIAVLRHQVRLLQRKRGRPPRLARWEKLTLAVLVVKLAGLVPGR